MADGAAGEVTELLLSLLDGSAAVLDGLSSDGDNEESAAAGDD